MIDLTAIDFAELKLLQASIGSEIVRREREEKAQALAEIRALVANRGFSLSDIVGDGSSVKQKGARKKVEAKYRHPQDANLSWSGRGRQPRWVVSYLETGGSLESIMIAK